MINSLIIKSNQDLEQLALFIFELYSENYESKLKIKIEELLINNSLDDLERLIKIYSEIQIGSAKWMIEKTEKIINILNNLLNEKMNETEAVVSSTNELLNRVV